MSARPARWAPCEALVSAVSGDARASHLLAPRPEHPRFRLACLAAQLVEIDLVARRESPHLRARRVQRARDRARVTMVLARDRAEVLVRRRRNRLVAAL